MLSVRQELIFRLLEASVQSGMLNARTMSEDKIREIDWIKGIEKTVDIFLQQTKERYQSDQDISLGKYLSEIHLSMVDMINLVEGKIPTVLDKSDQSDSNTLRENALAILEKSRTIEEISCSASLRKEGIGGHIKAISNTLRQEALSLLTLANQMQQHPQIEEEEE